MKKSRVTFIAALCLGIFLFSGNALADIDLSGEYRVDSWGLVDADDYCTWSVTHVGTSISILQDCQGDVDTLVGTANPVSGEFSVAAGSGDCITSFDIVDGTGDGQTIDGVVSCDPLILPNFLYFRDQMRKRLDRPGRGLRRRQPRRWRLLLG